MLNSKIVGAVICASLLFCGAASADQTRRAPLAEIRAQQLQIRSDVQAGAGAYKDMSQDKRDRLAARQTELLALIGDRQSLDELGEEEKTTALNALEWIRATITDAEDSRLVCERSRPVGSNRVQRVCATVAERRRLREAAVDDLSQRALCTVGELCRVN